MVEHLLMYLIVKFVGICRLMDKWELLWWWTKWKGKEIGTCWAQTDSHKNFAAKSNVKYFFTASKVYDCSRKKKKSSRGGLRCSNNCEDSVRLVAICLCVGWLSSTTMILPVICQDEAKYVLGLKYQLWIIANL